ncbi:uncharacterized protein H6S33_011744 [Morchella sextelata]|uniref:uncharacterized protein n=1 Tax=Morchella sextelata TaxID=1174677 RepID=UPI001D05227E|nr:uncharacterized protein H6S33_011744 [Morchella sextelata]KAH0610217.1 hypothetical protein H6S33_011744 [Morchella sextelata]
MTTRLSIRTTGQALTPAPNKPPQISLTYLQSTSTGTDKQCDTDKQRYLLSIHDATRDIERPIISRYVNSFEIPYGISAYRYRVTTTLSGYQNIVFCFYPVESAPPLDMSPGLYLRRLLVLSRYFDPDTPQTTPPPPPAPKVGIASRQRYYQLPVADRMKCLLNSL